MPASTGDTSFLTTVISFIQEGGPFMYIILGVLAIGLALTLERVIFLQLAKSRNQKVWNNLFPLMTKGQLKQALEIAKASDSGVGRIVSYGLARTTVSKRAEDVELAMEEGLMEVLPRLEARTNYIATLANIATLLGLLGTIMGLIQAFTAVASADPAQKADLLSASISVAMNTTAFGLIAAIPMLLAFSYLQAKTGSIVDSMEMASVKFLNIYRQVRSAADRRDAE